MPSLRAPPPSWARYARAVIEAAVRRNADAAARPAEPAALDGAALPADRPHAGVFVTLHKFRRLRGCMGTLDGSQPLSAAIRQAALSAALHDPRFQPVAPAELADLEIEVSILAPPQPMGSLDDLELGHHGVIVQRGADRGLFLPQVAVEHHLDKETLLSRCCSEKAGLPADAWRQPDTQVLLFTTEVVRED